MKYTVSITVEIECPVSDWDCAELRNVELPQEVAEAFNGPEFMQRFNSHNGAIRVTAYTIHSARYNTAIAL